MEPKQSHPKKKSPGCLTLKCSVFTSYLVSMTSNILLIATLYLTDHGYKWFGYFLHGLVLLLCVLSLKNLLNFSNKNLLRYKSATKYYSLALMLTGCFYFIVLIYLFVKQIDMDLIYYFAFCILVWCIFHGLFISTIKSFIRTLEDRPAQKGTNVKMIDKNLRDLMLSSNGDNL